MNYPFYEVGDKVKVTVRCQFQGETGVIEVVDNDVGLWETGLYTVRFDVDSTGKFYGSQIKLDDKASENRTRSAADQPEHAPEEVFKAELIQLCEEHGLVVVPTTSSRISAHDPMYIIPLDEYWLEFLNHRVYPLPKD